MAVTNMTRRRALRRGVGFETQVSADVAAESAIEITNAPSRAERFAFDAKLVADDDSIVAATSIAHAAGVDTISFGAVVTGRAFVSWAAKK